MDLDPNACHTIFSINKFNYDVIHSCQYSNHDSCPNKDETIVGQEKETFWYKTEPGKDKKIYEKGFEGDESY